MNRRSPVLIGGAVLISMLGLGCSKAPGRIEQPPPSSESSRPPTAPVADVTAGEARFPFHVAPKPLSPNVRKGLQWLASRQRENGGFGQGEEAEAMGQGMAGQRDRPNVADTCMAAVTLLRAGASPADGPYVEQVRKAIAFVCHEIEAAPEEGLAVTSVQGTRVQAKIGTYIDTFLAAQLLAEVQGRMPSPEENKRVLAALDKVMDKIEKNQRQDGTWDNRGWATILCQSVASRGLNRAVQSGVAVPERLLERMETRAKAAVGSEASGTIRLADAAGIPLYAETANLSILQEATKSAGSRVETLKQAADGGASPESRSEAARQLRAIADNREALAKAEQSVIARLDDPKFVSGFGSNGGEEFLSYLNISETLVVKGDETWKRWDRAMAQNLERVQNADGSWSGHHCITGRTFCTAAALMVLMADRTPSPPASGG